LHLFAQIWTLCNGQSWSGLARRQLTGVVAHTQSNPCTLHDVGLLSFRNKWCVPYPLSHQTLLPGTELAAARLVCHFIRPVHIFAASLLEHGMRLSVLRSCKHGIRGPAMGMVGKAWSSGALCVVQNPDTLPTMLHPRTKLEGAAKLSTAVLQHQPALHACSASHPWWALMDAPSSCCPQAQWIICFFFLQSACRA
jgi:hypothetical protein